ERRCDEPERRGTDDEAAWADLDDEGHDKHRADAGADQIPEVETLDSRRVGRENGDQYVTRETERHEECQVERAESPDRRQGRLHDLVIVEGQRVDDRV